MPDKAQNNLFDFEAAQNLYRELQRRGIPMTVATRLASEGSKGRSHGGLGIRLETAQAGLPSECSQNTIPNFISRFWCSPIISIFDSFLTEQNWVFFQNFCPRHGHKLSNVNEDISKNCPECRHDLFPKMSPCILVAVTYEDKILLVKHNNQIRNLFTVIAGFVELGESLEECVVREVKEEVGIDIDSVEYVGSQSWPFPNQLMVAFSAEAKSQDCVIDTQELLEAQWFAKNDLPTIPPKPSLSNYLIRRITDSQI